MTAPGTVVEDAGTDGFWQADDEVLRALLLDALRRQGLKFASREAFDKHGWREGPPPRLEKFWAATSEGPKISQDPFLWDLREALLEDRALVLNSILLWRRLRAYPVRYVGGMETAAIPLLGGLLLANRVLGGPPLGAFYLRKERKKDGLRRVLEGARPPKGAEVVIVDDILNKGISKKAVVDYCRLNGLVMKALLVTVEVGGKGRELFAPLCPVDALFTGREVLRGVSRVVASADPLGAHATRPVELPEAGDATGAAEAEEAATPVRVEVVERAKVASPPSRKLPPMSREDVELVRLARDTVALVAASGNQVVPTIGEDGRGSFGYLPFLGRYLTARGPVFTRISKRELKNGVWFNRMRGCQSVGLVDPPWGTFAEMTIKSAVRSATRARKVRPGPALFHKPVWPGELGDLSLFVYVVDELVPSSARTAEELAAEGHDVRHFGLIAEAPGYRGAACGDLDYVQTVEQQVAMVSRKMQSAQEIRPHAPELVRFTRMRGRWLYDPARPIDEYF